VEDERLVDRADDLAGQLRAGTVVHDPIDAQQLPDPAGAAHRERITPPRGEVARVVQPVRAGRIRGGERVLVGVSVVIERAREPERLLSDLRAVLPTRASVLASGGWAK
jgi:hypothetical protein